MSLSILIVNNCTLLYCAFQMVTAILKSLPEEERSDVLLMEDNAGQTAFPFVNQRLSNLIVSIH